MFQQPNQQKFQIGVTYVLKYLQVSKDWDLINSNDECSHIQLFTFQNLLFSILKASAMEWKTIGKNVRLGFA